MRTCCFLTSVQLESRRKSGKHAVEFAKNALVVMCYRKTEADGYKSFECVWQTYIVCVETSSVRNTDPGWQLYYQISLLQHCKAFLWLFSCLSSLSGIFWLVHEARRGREFLCQCRKRLFAMSKWNCFCWNRRGRRIASALVERCESNLPAHVQAFATCYAIATDEKS